MLKVGRFPFATVRKRHAVQSRQAEVPAASIRVNANATARGPRACQANGRAGQQKLRRLRESRLRSSLPEDLREYLGVDRAALSRVRRRGRAAAGSCGAFVVSGARRRRPRLGLLQEREAPIVERKAGWADRLLSHGLNRKGGRESMSAAARGAPRPSSNDVAWISRCVRLKRPTVGKSHEYAYSGMRRLRGASPRSHFDLSTRLAGTVSERERCERRGHLAARGGGRGRRGGLALHAPPMGAGVL